MSKPNAGAKLIEAAKARSAGAGVFAGPAREALLAVLAYNDTVSRLQRVRAADAITMMREEYGITMGRSKFHFMVRATFGRGYEG